MNHVRDAVSTLGTDHQFAPPHQQALNEAEKVADTGTVCARADAQPSLSTMLRTTYFRSWLITQCTLTSGLQQLPIAIEDGRLHVYELSRSTQPPIIKLHRPFTRTKIQTQTADIKRAPPHASRTRQICRFSQPILIHIRNHAGSTLQGPTGRRQTGTDWYIVSTLLLMTTISLLASYHKLHLSYQHHQRSMLVTLVLQLRGRMATVMMKTPFHHSTEPSLQSAENTNSRQR